MNYYKDGKEFTLREVKVLHKNVSFREPTQLGYSVILPTPKPECGELQQAIHNGVETDSKGNLVRAWKIVDMFTDYTNEDGVVVTKAEQEQAYLAKKLEDKQKELERTIEAHIDSVVKSKGYNNQDSISKYLVSTNPFYVECEALSVWIGNVWTTAITIMNDVKAGTREVPTDIISELPTLE